VAFDGPLADRLAIRERIDSYSDAVFRRDAEAWIANWIEDATWSLPGLSVTGKDAIKALWVDAMAGFSFAAFFAVPGHIRIDGDRAEGRVYTREVLVDHDGKVRKIIGAYDDTLAKQGGVWLFTRRVYDILRQEPPEA
jgi:ketosteroid isomerase-like protein